MVRVRRWAVANKAAAALIVLVVLFAGAVSAVGAAQATDQPAFCQAACHEMQPFGAAWSQGPHSDIGCVECHVEPGMVARLQHKTVAMQELWVHVSGEPKFPRVETAVVPNERCVRCHESINTPGFDHAKHAAGRQCQSCHATAGHSVGLPALKAAGVLNVTLSQETTPGPVAVPDQGSANVPGHVPTTCERCHDMARTGCQSCHSPEHKNTEPRKIAGCETCHKPGVEFAFAHPTGKLDCGSCHSQPTEKHDFPGDCASCHTKQGASWAFDHNSESICQDCHSAPEKHREGACATCHQPDTAWKFTHPSSTSKCESCHERPAKHRDGACTRCHSAGKSWSFKHPKNRACTECHNRPANHRSGTCTTCHAAGSSWAFRHPTGRTCTQCHARPSGHRSGSCTTCHRAGRSWSFRHPGQSARCTTCHKRPSGHRSGSCSSCHRAGRSWAFRHTSGIRCSSCHKSPSNHYGTSCGRCHSPSRSWSKASIAHARIPGGEHTNKSFACSKCHPRGYSSHTCIKCHSSASGPRDD